MRSGARQHDAELPVQPANAAQPLIHAHQPRGQTKGFALHVPRTQPSSQGSRAEVPGSTSQHRKHLPILQLFQSQAAHPQAVGRAQSALQSDF